MQPELENLKTILSEVSDLYYASALLSWDQQVNMPPAGAAKRGAQLGTLRRLAHLKFTSEEVGQWLSNLKPGTGDLPPNSTEARLIAVASREYEKATRVPADFVTRRENIIAPARRAWAEARAQSRFSIFEPHLEKIVDMSREYISFFEPFDHVYDPLLDDFEPGMKTSEVQAIFAAIRPHQVALIQAIAAQPQVDDSALNQAFDRQKQWDFGIEVITKIGYDFQRGRQDLSPHPFTTSFGLNDVRITTRVQDNFFNAAFFGTLHETGHALYSQGLEKSLAGTPLARGASLAIHESQSRMWENLVGRSRPFWEHFYPRLQEVFPRQLANVSLETFYQAVNKVEPSLIRVEADEATYNLHIMIRLEIEIALMEGRLAVRDLPEVWNQAMRDDLGLTPPDDAHGVLQDIHWSGGMLGYFSTYALGNLVSAQLWECIENDIPDLQEQIRRGAFDELVNWTRQKIHQHGAKFEPQELVEKVTGSRIDPQPYLAYLQRKFGALYQL